MQSLPESPPKGQPHHLQRRVARWLLTALAGAALALVYSWYLSPHFVVDMATRLWSCF